MRCTVTAASTNLSPNSDHYIHGSLDDRQYGVQSRSQTKNNPLCATSIYWNDIAESLLSQAAAQIGMPDAPPASGPKKIAAVLDALAQIVISSSVSSTLRPLIVRPCSSSSTAVASTTPVAVVGPTLPGWRSLWPSG